MFLFVGQIVKDSKPVQIFLKECEKIEKAYQNFIANIIQLLCKYFLAYLFVRPSCLCILFISFLKI